MTYDDWKTTPPWDGAPDPDEGMVILEGAMKYLKPRADADNDDNGDWEAYAILDMACDQINDEYTCRHCGKQIHKRNTYCSRNCARADEL